MEKKYQVFISSTYEDLKDERKEVYNALLDSECIPAGMELFYATDKDQFTVIKKIIDYCDYYVLIIGGRYGTINLETGKSYTEMEYDYAISKKIPVLVFAFDDISKLPIERKETDKQKIDLLNYFKNKAMNNRMANFWKDKSELRYKVVISINKAKQEFDRPGWIRGDENFSPEKIISLLEENNKLKKELENVISKESKNDSSFLNRKIKINFTRSMFALNSDTQNYIVEEEFSYGEILKKIGGDLLAEVELDKFKQAINHMCSYEGTYLATAEIHTTIKGFFAAHDIISVKSKNSKEFITLTDDGKKLYFNLIG